MASSINRALVSSSVTFYNGDDALALVKNDVVIDAFGIIGSDPGTSWTVGRRPKY